jgi:hypothetical protein
MFKLNRIVKGTTATLVAALGFVMRRPKMVRSSFAITFLSELLHTLS